MCMFVAPEIRVNKLLNSNGCFSDTTFIPEFWLRGNISHQSLLNAAQCNKHTGVPPLLLMQGGFTITSMMTLANDITTFLLLFEQQSCSLNSLQIQSLAVVVQLLCPQGSPLHPSWSSSWRSSFQGWASIAHISQPENPKYVLKFVLHN